MFCVLGYALTQLLAPWPLKLIIDSVLLEKPLPALLNGMGGLGDLILGDRVFAVIVLSLSIVAIAILGGVFSYSHVYLTSRIGYELVHRLRAICSIICRGASARPRLYHGAAGEVRHGFGRARRDIVGRPASTVGTLLGSRPARRKLFSDAEGGNLDH